MNVSKLLRSFTGRLIGKSWVGRQRKGTGRRIPSVEELESRLAPAVFTWIGQGNSPSWFDKDNWDYSPLTGAGAPTTLYPTIADDVFIGTTGPTTVGVPGDAPSIPEANSLTTSGDVAIAAPLTLAASLNISGIYRGGAEFESQTATITGGGQIIGGSFSGNGNLTILDGITITGNSFLNPVGQLINHGTIEAASGGTIFVGSLDFVNQGTLSAQSGGTLQIGGVTWSTSTPITCTDTGTVLLEGGTLSNGATPVTFSGNGTWLFSGGTVKNTTVNLTDGAKGTFQDMRLDGATFNGDAQVSSINGNGGSLIVRDSDTINGTLTLGDNSGTQRATILSDGVGTIGGDLTIVSTDTSKLGTPNDIQIGFGSPTVTTLAATVTIRGKSLLFTGAPTNTLINQGTISADVAGSTFIIQQITWQNDGTVQAMNGGRIDAVIGLSLGEPDPSALTNFSNGTLTHGTWQVYDNSTIHLPITDITTNAANILLDGPNARLLRDNGTDALGNLAANVVGASLTVQDGKSQTIRAALTNGGAVTVGAGSTLTTLVPTYANSVIAFSSQGGPDYYDGAATAALGPPDGYAWNPSSINGTQEYLTVGFTPPQRAVGVIVREQYGNGFVTRIDLLDTSGVYHTVWTGTDPTTAGTPADFVATFPTTSYLVQGVKVYVNTNASPGYEGIDAVGLLTDQTTYTQTGGSTALNGGTLNAIGAVALQGGTLTGTGTVNTARVVNAAQVSPGSPYGTLTVSGDYVQTAAGALAIALGGPSGGGQFSNLQVTGAASLGGALAASEPGGYVPQVGDSYGVLTFASRTGDFASEAGLVLSNTLSLLPTYDAVSLHLVAEAPPTVQSVVVNDGSAQRSMVNSLTVTFSGVVTLGSGAVEVDKVGGAAEGVVVNTSVVNGRTVAVITFTGADIAAGSLADGRYNLVIHGSLIQDASGQLVDGDGDGQAAGDGVVSFFRLLGDTNGDGVVDARDYAAFRAAYNARRGQASYLWYLDFDGNGVIDLTDYNAFRANYGRSI